jgi:hypothetical protein
VAPRPTGTNPCCRVSALRYLIRNQKIFRIMSSSFSEDKFFTRFSSYNTCSIFFPLCKKSYVVTENSVVSLLAKELRDLSLRVVYTISFSGNADANLTCLVVCAVGDFCKRREYNSSYAVVAFGLC